MGDASDGGPEAALDENDDLGDARSSSPKQPRGRTPEERQLEPLGGRLLKKSPGLAFLEGDHTGDGDLGLDVTRAPENRLSRWIRTFQ